MIGEHVAVLRQLKQRVPGWRVSFGSRIVVGAAHRLMDRSGIIEKIRRLAATNGRAAGWHAFQTATGIRKSDWYPHLWLRWGDVLRDPGFAPNAFQSRLDDEVIIGHYLAGDLDVDPSPRRKLDCAQGVVGHLPVDGELRRKARSDKSFPNATAFARFGGKKALIDRLSEYCRDKRWCGALSIEAWR